MLIISRTPVRISFFGGGTDYPSFYLEHGGAVLGTTIDQYTYISVKTLPGRFFEYHMRIAYSRTELVSQVSEIEHPSIRECLKYKGFDDSLEVHIFSDLPARTGLGSSSSFTVGFLNALYALRGEAITPQKLAEEACHVEQNLIRENVGSQDQFHAAYGGFSLIEFQSKEVVHRPLKVCAEKKSDLEQHLLIFFTGMTRHASQVVKEQIEKTQQRKNDAYLKEMRQMVYQAEKLLLTSPKEVMAKEFGELLHESWTLKKQLSEKVSNPFIDEAYAAAIKAGAYGGKLCGAGSGGFLAFFAPPEKQNQVREALKTLQEVNFCFEDQGSSIIYMKD